MYYNQNNTFKNIKPFSRAGFTIVELLVVIAIIALLVSLTFAMLQSARAKSRDAERESEIKSFQNALALHIVNNKIYPTYTGAITGADALSTQLLNSGALSGIPKDPLNTGNYVYQYSSSDGSAYVITYFLETDTITGKFAGQQTAGP